MIVGARSDGARRKEVDDAGLASAQAVVVVRRAVLELPVDVADFERDGSRNEHNVALEGVDCNGSLLGLDAIEAKGVEAMPANT